MEDAFTLYLRDVARTPLLSLEEEKALFAVLKDRASVDGPLIRERFVRRREARDHLCRANLRLVVQIARHYQHRGVPLPDLVEEGNLGLLRAIEGFDPQKGCKLCTYATWWIRQKIRHSIESTPRLVYVPNQLLRFLLEWDQAQAALQSKLGRMPTAVEIGARLHFRPARVELIRQASQANSFGRGNQRGHWSDDDNDLFGPDSFADPASTHAPAGLDWEELARLAQGLQKLRKRDRQVLELRFGLVDGRPLTLGEIGQRMGRTRERVRQIEKRALAQMRVILTSPRAPQGSPSAP